MDESKVKDYSLSAGEALLDLWYPALLSKRIKRGQMRRQMVLNTPLLVCRDSAGVPFVLDDHCPHRGMPLSFGRFDGKLVECCYHGWRFDSEGRCRHIPSLLSDSPIKPERIQAESYRSAEADGLIWVLMPGPRAGKDSLPELPKLPVFSRRYRQVVVSRKLACSADDCIVGLIDPVHSPFVHQSLWWRSPKSMDTKVKVFEPIPNGFRMRAHTPSANSAAYKLLKVYGEEITTTIDFVLPNVRIEQIRCGRHWLSNRTTITAVTNEESRLDFVAAWNIFSWVPMVTPIFRLFAEKFIAQDQETMGKLAVGLKDNPPLMLIDEADTQAKWYYRLKAAYLETQRSSAEMEHPLQAPVTLRWRS